MTADTLIQHYSNLPTAGQREFDARYAALLEFRKEAHGLVAHLMKTKAGSQPRPARKHVLILKRNKKLQPTGRFPEVKKHRQHMKTIRAKDSGSIGIRKHFAGNMELECIGSTGEGDCKMTLWRARTGQEVIETNAEPIWEGETGFADARDAITHD